MVQKIRMYCCKVIRVAVTGCGCCQKQPRVRCTSRILCDIIVQAIIVVAVKVIFVVTIGTLVEDAAVVAVRIAIDVRVVATVVYIVLVAIGIVVTDVGVTEIVLWVV